MHSARHKPVSHSAQGWQTFTFKRLLWKDPLQCRRFQPQLYGEYIVVRSLMKMEESVYSCKQLSVKDGEVIYSLYEEQYSPPPPSDCHSFNEELTYLRGMIQEQSIRQLIGCGSKMEVKKSTVLHYLCVCACACMCCWCLLSLGWVSFKTQKKRKCSVYTEYVSRSVNTGRWEQKHFSDNVKDAFKQE